MMSNPITDDAAAATRLMTLLEDPDWHVAADAAEDALSVSILAGRGPVGWMTTWPRLETYCFAKSGWRRLGLSR